MGFSRYPASSAQCILRDTGELKREKEGCCKAGICRASLFCRGSFDIYFHSRVNCATVRTIEFAQKGYGLRAFCIVMDFKLSVWVVEGS